MTDLAQTWGEGPVSLSKIAIRSNLSYGYLEQLILALRRHGLVKAHRGARGGYILSRAPDRISFREIIQALDGELAPVACVSDQARGICPTSRSCQSKKVWKKIKKSLLETLGSVKLKEVLS